MLCPLAHASLQLSGAAPYSLDCLLACLRLYLVFPEASKTSVVCQCLLLGLQRTPESDFSLCLHLVPERLQGEPEVLQLVTLAGHLEACRYKDFWAAVAQPAPPALQQQQQPLAAAARAFIAGTLSGAYRSLPAALADEALRFGGDVSALGAFVAAQPGWAMEAGVVTLPRTQGNDPQPAAALATIPFGKLESLFAGAAV